MRSGFFLSLMAHAGLVLVFVVIWNLLPIPDIRPIRISLMRYAPTREQVGLTPDGRLTPTPVPSPSPSTTIGP